MILIVFRTVYSSLKPIRTKTYFLSGIRSITKVNFDLAEATFSRFVKLYVYSHEFWFVYYSFRDHSDYLVFSLLRKCLKLKKKIKKAVFYGL